MCMHVVLSALILSVCSFLELALYSNLAIYSNFEMQRMLSTVCLANVISSNGCSFLVLETSIYCLST